ncbi:MAG: hypothetical protein H6835_19715 [Planctomycetes bacterium]|nr:hypothetical protein [Planctomycetota bacterium]
MSSVLCESLASGQQSCSAAKRLLVAFSAALTTKCLSDAALRWWEVIDARRQADERAASASSSSLPLSPPTYATAEVNTAKKKNNRR